MRTKGATERRPQGARAARLRGSVLQGREGHAAPQACLHLFRLHSHSESVSTQVPCTTRLPWAPGESRLCVGSLARGEEPRVSDRVATLPSGPQSFPQQSCCPHQPLKGTSPVGHSKEMLQVSPKGHG